MKLIEKLTISTRKGYISLFDEGLFLRIYNESAYIINELQQQNLALSCNTIKNLQNRPIVYCAFPQKYLHNRFCGLIKTPWGYEIAGSFDTTDYDNWFKWAFAHALERTQKRNAAKLHYSTYSSSRIATEHKSTHQSQQTRSNQNEINDNSERVYLDSQQIAFLKMWQRGIYPNAVTEGFVESLKQQLTKTE